MFKQFTEHVEGNQVYLLWSLAIFFFFFVVVTIMLIRMRKNYVSYMSDIPLNDTIDEPRQTLAP